MKHCVLYSDIEFLWHLCKYLQTNIELFEYSLGMGMLFGVILQTFLASYASQEVFMSLFLSLRHKNGILVIETFHTYTYFLIRTHL